MEKLSEYLLSHPEATEAPAEIPQLLSADEEREVLEQLGVQEQPDASHPALDLIMAKMKNVREFSLATGKDAVEAENDEVYADYGTVIIKTKDGRATQGTLRLKKGDDRFGSIIFRGGDVEPQDLPGDAFSTMRVIETSSSDDTKPLWASSGSSGSSGSAKPAGEGNFLWRAPEAWEVNIIALERGEWAQNMPEEAFRKYKKERPKLGGLFRGESHFFDLDSVPVHSASSPSFPSDSKTPTPIAPPMPTPSSAPTSPRTTPKASSEKTKKRKSSRKSKSTDKADKSEKSEKKEKDKEKDKEDKKDKERERTSSSPSPGKERKWAVFKRTAENRQRLADA